MNLRCYRCQGRLAKERDLEGIDMSNIVSGDRRVRRAAAVAAPINYAAMDKSSGSDEQASSSEEASSASGSEGVFMAYGFLVSVESSPHVCAPLKLRVSMHPLRLAPAKSPSSKWCQLHVSLAVNVALGFLSAAACPASLLALYVAMAGKATTTHRWHLPNADCLQQTKQRAWMVMAMT